MVDVDGSFLLNPLEIRVKESKGEKRRGERREGRGERKTEQECVAFGLCVIGEVLGPAGDAGQ